MKLILCILFITISKGAVRGISNLDLLDTENETQREKRDERLVNTPVDLLERED